MSLFKQTPDGLFENPERKNEQVTLEDIKEDTGDIKSILDKFGGVAIERMKKAEQLQRESVREMKRTVDNTVRHKVPIAPQSPAHDVQSSKAVLRSESVA
ncbi:hypothetical protein [Chelonobacter oris]|uniref:hypothetical protein n=1 Tax=Chelonobacter oris TaxID=505317 RepID=UPI00244703BD|nr:hypothetical protein [Chelonobacter oris]